MPVSPTPQVLPVLPGIESQSDASLERLGSLDRESGLPAVEWRPIESAMRIVGPGRQEVQMRVQIKELEVSLHAAKDGQADAQRSLEVAQLVERGTARFVDRVEAEINQANQQIRRLAAALGALTSENEKLHNQLGSQRKKVQLLEGGQRSKPARGWRRWFR